MVKNKDMNPLSDFDWEEFEKGIEQNDDSYDIISTYNQGVAIISKQGKYGAIIVGNKIIVKPIYASLSPFDNGYAKARYFKGDDTDERVINLSGQISVEKENEKVFLPDDYDWGYDFKKNICIVIKFGKYGIIDNNFNTVVDCIYSSFEDSPLGYVILRNENNATLVNYEATICYRIIDTYDDGYMTITNGDSNLMLYGVIDSQLNLVVPISYKKLNRLNCGYFVADSNQGTNLFIDPHTGEIVMEESFSSVRDLNKNNFVAYQKEPTNGVKTNVYNASLKLILTIPAKIQILTGGDFVDWDGRMEFVYEDNRFLFNSSGELFVIRNQKCRKVNHEYLNYNHKPFSDKYEIIEDKLHLKGLSDWEGNTMISPQYKELFFVSNELFVVAIQSKDNIILFGVINMYNEIVVPFKYRYLLPINAEYLAYTMDEVGFINNRLDLGCHYANIKFGITDISAKKKTRPIFSTIKQATCQSFIVTIETGKYNLLKYGVITTSGRFLIEPKYESINYDDNSNCFITSILGKSPCETIKNKVSVDGFFLITDNTSKTYKVSVKIADWCGCFSKEGFATIIKDGNVGHINKFNQLISFHKGVGIVVSDKYDFACDFKYGYASVLINGKYGIINIEQQLVIPSEYDYIEALSEESFMFRVDDKWGVLDVNQNIIVEAIYTEIVRETDLFIKVQIPFQRENPSEMCYGILNKDGVEIIPCHYKVITKLEKENRILFIVEIGRKQGVYDENGIQIIPEIYDNIVLNDKILSCQVFGNKGLGYSFGEKKIEIENNYSLLGEQIINLDNQFTIIAPAEYDLAYYLGMGVIRVMKNGKWGLINTSNAIVVPPQYTFIRYFNKSFIEVVNGFDDNGDQLFYYYGIDEFIENEKVGLIDTLGELVLPVDYDYIDLWDNGYIYVQKEEYNHNLLTPSLNVAVELHRKKCKKLDNRFLIIDGYSSTYQTFYGLIDYYGNEIISGNEYGCYFSEIKIFENGYLKVIHNHDCPNGLKGCSQISIANDLGKIIYTNERCEDITYLQNGLFLVKGFNFTSTDGDGYYVYNLVNLQGKEIFERFYEEIRILGDGNFLIKDKGNFGMANHAGSIFVPVEYKNEIKFENGFSFIEIAGCEEKRKIDANGQVIVLDSNNCEKAIPKDFYWASNYIDNLCVVRQKSDSWSKYIGVINENEEIVISPQYKKISILENRTIRVKEDDCYGIFNFKGECIFPVIFTTLEYLGKDRIRVVWNLKIATSWEKGKYTPGVSKYKLSSSSNDYFIFNRAALCRSDGTPISDSKYCFIGRFKNGYALSYCKISIEESKLKFSQIGVIDLDGNTVIPPKYDVIVLYGHHFARLIKDGIVGIANLVTKEVHMFDDFISMKAWEIDQYGRFLFATDGEYDSDDEELTGNIGVMRWNKIIVPLGKYDKIDFLRNGLIKVFDEKASKVGLLGVDGELISSMEYSYISNFINDKAAVCIGGHKEESWPYQHVGGKWGVIDKMGKQVVECIYANRSELPIDNTNNTEVKSTPEYVYPRVICSDYIPNTNHNTYRRNSYYFDNYEEDDNYSKYGGYNGYDDETIDEAFDGDPSLTWNID